MKSNEGRFLHCAASAAEIEAVSFSSQISDGDAKNAVLNKLRQQKSLNGNKRSQADREDVFSADCVRGKADAPPSPRSCVQRCEPSDAPSTSEKCIVECLKQLVSKRTALSLETFVCFV
jgi:hypothetical protein